MNKYYYLVATLPYLVFGEKPPISKKAFLAECEKWLSEKEIKIFSSAGADYDDISENDTPFVLGWKEFNTRLCNELASSRGAEEAALSGMPGSSEVKKILEKENPLIMEKALEEIRWEYIEGKSRGFFFDFDALLAYFLKLGILERLAEFDKDEGEKYFYEFCEVKHE